MCAHIGKQAEAAELAATAHKRREEYQGLHDAVSGAVAVAGDAVRSVPAEMRAERQAVQEAKASEEKAAKLEAEAKKVKLAC